MYFTEIRLIGFRNYEDERIQFHPKVNVITGNNAQGKTNLLESLSLMNMGKSFRTGRDSEMIGFDKEFCRVDGTFIKDGECRKIQVEFNRSGRVIRIDGVKREKNADLLELAYVVVFSPEDMKIVKEDPEKRRRFMDRELFQIKSLYYKNLSRYKKALLQRNNLLRGGSAERDTIAPWDQILATYGMKVILERREFIKKLDVISRELHSQITDGREELSLSYECSMPFFDPLMDGKEAYLLLLEEEFEKDLLRGSTGMGPHRDDMKITVNSIDVRHFGSQGQQRTAALSLKLAELGIIKEETGVDAVLLLDDVLSELDEERQKFLIKSLKKNQIFITTADLTDSLLTRLPDHQILTVSGGKVSSCMK